LIERAERFCIALARAPQEVTIMDMHTDAHDQ
jgi:hypothetical protein